MKIDVVTLFPDMFSGPMGTSIVGRARRRGQLRLGLVNPRDFSRDRHRRVDDRPFGGGAGMILMAPPLHDAVKSVARKGSRVIFLSPQGRRFDAASAARLSRKRHLVLVCGHYEGIDERLSGLFDEEISIGDYVLTGGELPAMVLVDAVTRLLPGVLKKAEAAQEESFAAGELDFPQYTRPRVWKRKKVPAALLSGDHERISRWRRSAARKATRLKRPDLLSGLARRPAK